MIPERLEAAVAKAPASAVDPDAAAAPGPASPAEQEVLRLQQQLRAMRTSWTWRLGRMLTKPLDLFARR